MPNNTYANPFGQGMPGMENWSELGKTFFETNPQAGLSYFGSSLGGSNPFQRWLNNQFERYYNNYYAQANARMNRGEGNENFQWLDYLMGITPKEEFAGMTPIERFEFPGLYSPRSRWVR